MLVQPFRRSGLPGFVPRELVIGRAMFVYWSYKETEPFNSPLDFFTNTRWSRTGTMVK